MAYKLKVDLSASMKGQILELHTTITNQITNKTIDFQDDVIRKSLIKLGWRPPLSNDLIAVTPELLITAKKYLRTMKQIIKGQVRASHMGYYKKMTISVKELINKAEGK